MKLIYEVPAAAKRAAERALALQRERPLEDVGGRAVGEALAQGLVTVDVAAKMRRFFTVNSRQYEAELQLLHTEEDSVLLRSWMLYGAESGRSWADRIHKQAVREGYVGPDPITDLLGLTPDEIYESFSLGAWRFEYDLNPRKAARFVEEYHRATGWNLDLRRAFGASAGAVGNALFRRFHPIDPFKEAARCLAVEDAEYRLAAQVDLEELTRSIDALEEGLKQATYNAAPSVTAKMVWPGFVAYVILAVERPDLLKAVNQVSQKPPAQELAHKGFTVYNDAIWTYVTFFHPGGVRWVDPKQDDPKNAKLYGSIPEEFETLMLHAYYGKHVSPAAAQKLLGKARRWTAQNKFAGSLFHVYNADWKKGNWQHILDNIPEDHDVRPAFAEFVKQNVAPSAGIKLQQTLSDKKWRTKVAAYLYQQGFVGSDDPVLLQSIKIDDTETGKVCQQIGTPLGVYSLCHVGPTDKVCLGAFNVKSDAVFVFVGSDPLIKEFPLVGAFDWSLQTQFKGGNAKVLQAHKDMPGTTYGGKAPTPPTSTHAEKNEPTTSVPASLGEKEPLPPEFVAYLKSHNWNLGVLDAGYLVDLKSTQFYEKAVGKFGVVKVGQSWLRTEEPKAKLRLAFAAQFAGDIHIVFTVSAATPQYRMWVDYAAAGMADDGILHPKTEEQPQLEPAQDKTSKMLAQAAEQVNHLNPAVGAKPLEISKTYWWVAAFQQTGVRPEVGTEWRLKSSKSAIAQKGMIDFRVIGALATKENVSIAVVYEVIGTGEMGWTLDSKITHATTAGRVLPLAQALKQKQPVKQEPVSAVAVPAAEPFSAQSFQPYDVVTWNGSNWQVVGKPGVSPYEVYYLVELVLSPAAVYATASQVSASMLEQNGQLVQSAVTDLGLLWQYTVVEGGWNKIVGSPSPAVGDTVSFDGEGWKVTGYISTSSDGTGTRIVLARHASKNLGSGWVVQVEFQTISVLVLPVASSYNPNDVAPEKPAEQDEPDPEQGLFEMSGTQAALNFIVQRKWTPAVASESALFKFPLGGRQHYGVSKTRTIIGYAFDANKIPVYVHVTEVDNIGWVSCVNAHSKYGPLAKMVPLQVSALLPKPGEKAKQKFPKLNYKLSKKAKEVAQKLDLIYAPAPEDPLFLTGTPLYAPGGKTKVVLLGWTNAGSSVGLLRAVIWFDASETVALETSSKLVDYSLRYQYETAFEEDGSVTFGKLDSEPIAVTNGPFGLLLPSPPEPGWDSPPPVQQPPFDALPSGKHVSAGVLAFVPAGTNFHTGSAGTATTEHPGVLLYHPLGQYGGYKLSIPKGTVEKGESLLKTAVREVKEETGLVVRPVAHLGDFHANQSVTRVFIGYVVAGNPKKKTQPEECDAVTFRTLSPEYKDKSWYKQLVPESGNKWQQHAVDAAYEWLQANGFPSAYVGPTTTDDAAVATTADVTDPFAGVDPHEFVTPLTKAAFPKSVADVVQKFTDGVKAFAKAAQAAQDTGQAFVTSAQGMSQAAKELTNWAPSIPATQTFQDDVWKTLLFKAPFPVTAQMVEELKTSGATPVSFDCARDHMYGPKYGQAFETEVGTPYTAAGYVHWLGVDGQLYHFLLAVSGAGSVTALACDADGYKKGHVVSDQTVANLAPDAWFQHPDPVINAAIQKVFETGSLTGAGVNIQVFKTQWMKAAKVPAYAVITQNVLRDVASMFVAGACSQPQRDTIIGCLKARMKATHSTKKVEPNAPMSIDLTGLVPAQPNFPPPAYQPAEPKTILTLGPLSPLLTQYVNNPQPHLFSLADASPKTITKGSKPSVMLFGPAGRRWLAKYGTHGEEWRSYHDRAAYQLCELIKPNNVPVGVMTFEGKTVSYQPFAENAKAVVADPSELDEPNMAELLSQHAADMFVGDHDGNATNWINVDGRIIAVDRGQAFKFVFLGQKESLDPKWHAPGNIGKGYAKALLLQWANGDTEIPAVAWSAMLRTIRGVQALTKEQLLAILTPVFDAHGTSLEEQARIEKELLARKSSYEKDWTTVLRKLRRDFAWPATTDGIVAPTKVFTSSPKDLGFGKRETTTIAEAIAAKWQGKSLRCGGIGIENQEVLVRRVLWEEKPGLKIPSTFLHFRVARPSGVDAAKKLYGFAGLEFTDTLGGPQRLKADQQGNYWEHIYAAIKTINHHLFIKKDAEINVQTVGQATGMRPTLQGIVAITGDPAGVYAPTNEPNEAVYAMAEQYLQYVGILEYWMTHKTELVGQHSPMLAEFLWEPPPLAKAQVKNAPPYKVYLKKQGALWPTATPVGQDVHVTNLNKPVMNSSHQSQFVVEDPLTKARIFWCPPGGLHTSGLENVKDGVESLKGQGWAIIPGEPSPATVAHLLKLFEDATGISMSAATPEDEAVLYWSKQASALQANGAVKPKSDGTTVLEPGYVAAIGEYRSGNKPQAVSRLKAFVAQKLGQPVETVEEMASKSDVQGAYTRGAGFVRHTRIGWDRERLAQVMGKECRVAHHLAEDVVSWMQAMRNNGALIANAIKPYYGVTKTGASPGEDMNRGGGQGLFLCFRKGIDSHAGMIYFDISLALRLDLYIVGTGDTYGSTTETRYMTPEQWVGIGAHKHTGICSASSGLQVNVRHDIDLQTYLTAVVCGNEGARSECVAIAHDLGWTFFGGATPEQVFRA